MIMINRAFCCRSGLFVGVSFAVRNCLFTACLASTSLKAQPALATAKTDHPQLAQFNTRVSEMLRQVTAAVPAAPVPNLPEGQKEGKSVDAAQSNALQQLANETSDDLEVHLR